MICSHPCPAMLTELGQYTQKIVGFSQALVIAQCNSDTPGAPSPQFAGGIAV